MPASLFALLLSLTSPGFEPHRGKLPAAELTEDQRATVSAFGDFVAAKEVLATTHARLGPPTT